MERLFKALNWFRDALPGSVGTGEGQLMYLVVAGFVCVFPRCDNPWLLLSYVGMAGAVAAYAYARTAFKAAVIEGQTANPTALTGFSKED